MTSPKKTRKQEIIEAALQCFTEHGVEATTIEMIRERSGASVGSLYHHFGNKESIAAAIFNDAMEEHAERQQALLAQASTVEAGVKALAYAYIDWIADNPERAHFALYSRGYLAKGEAAATMNAGKRKRLSSVLAWFRPHIASGGLKKLPIECYASLITGPAHDYARLWLSGRAKTNIKAYREIFAEAAWNAVKPESLK